MGDFKMQTLLKGNYCLSGNALKIIAAISMIIDHVGVILLPKIIVLRIIGRISFPIFAFMIAEGATHTKNKLKYFLFVFLLGAICQTALYIVKGPEKLNVLLSFSVAILGIYALQYMKSNLFSKNKKTFIKLLLICFFIVFIVGIYLLNQKIRIDYGFWGCMLPISVSIFKLPKEVDLPGLKKLDNLFLHLILFAVCLVFLTLKYKWIQSYALFSIPFLLFYSGKRGRYKMKYFFYIFYPAHLVVLEGIGLILKHF